MVTSIGADAFSNALALTSITVNQSNTNYKGISGVLFDSSGATMIRYPRGNTRTNYEIPASVTSIVYAAFYAASSLTSITFEAGSQLTSIGDWAFQVATSLTSINIPATVTSIGSNAFYGSGLTSITFAEGSQLTNIEDSGFYQASKLTSINIPEGVTSIGEQAFQYSGLTSITFAEGSQLTSIGQGAFQNTSNLTSIDIPEGVTSIGNSAFSRTSLTSITIPASVTSIENYAFYYATSLTSIIIPESVTSIGSSAFFQASSLTSVTFAEGSQLTSIGNSAFSDASSLTSITIPASVTSIGSGAFYGSGLKTVYIANGQLGITSPATNVNFFEETVTTSNIYYSDDETTATFLGISGETLSGKNGLAVDLSGATVAIVKGYGSIGSSAFASSGLTSIIISASVTSIGNYAFASSSLTSITVTPGNTNYKDISGVLFNYSGATLIQYPAGNTRTTYDIPEDVTSIGANAFQNATTMTSITIPASVTSIGLNAFNNTSSLTSVTFKKDSQLDSIGSGAFYYADRLTSIEIPASVESIGANAFQYSGLTTVYIPRTNNLYLKKGTQSLGGVTVNVSYTDEVISATEADFAIQPLSSNYDVETGIVTVTVNNIGGKESTGYNNKDWCVVYQVIPVKIPSPVAPESDTEPEPEPEPEIPSSLKHATVVRIGDTMYYPSAIANYNIQLIETTVTNNRVNYDLSAVVNQNISYITNEPLLKPNDSITYKFTGNFEQGKTYMFVADSIITDDIGDTVEILDNNLTNSNNYFAFTVPFITVFTYSNDTETTTSYSTSTIIDNNSYTDPDDYFLTEVNISPTVTSIGYAAFLDASGLTSVTFAEGSQLTSIGDWAFRSSGLTSINIPESVTNIGEYAFRSSGLTSVTFAEGSQLTSIGDSAFFGASSLTSITIPESVTNIGATAFYKASGLTSITFAEGSQLTSIGEYAFDQVALTSITIPAGVTSIGDYTFYKASGLTSIDIPEGVTSIGNSAFSGASSLTSITIPASVTNIGATAFYKASGLTSITFAEGSQLTYIGNSAFSDASSLTSITIPASVTSIGSGAFQNSGLTEATINVDMLGKTGFPTSLGSGQTIGGKTGVNIIGYKVFTGTGTLSGATSDLSGATIAIIEGYASIGEQAFFDATSLTSIIIPASVTSIGTDAFASSGLKTVYIPSSNNLNLSEGSHELGGVSVNVIYTD
jgi:hypothetical protein